MIRVSGQSKSRPVKAAGAEVAAQRRHQKLHAAVAKSIFWSENAKELTVSDHFFEVQMSKNCTPLWRKAHSEVKMYKTWRVWTTFVSSDVGKCTPLWRKVHSEVKMYKTWRVWTTFVSSDLEQMHAPVAKGTFGSENVQNTSVSEHFLKFRCRKIARRCGEMHILKWKCTKHVSFGALFEVLMSKN